MERRVVLTGIGVVHPLGHGVGALMESLGQAPSSRTGGAVRALKDGGELWTIEGLDDSRYLNARLKRKLDAFCAQGLAAAGMACESAGLTGDACDAERVGIFVGNCLGGWGFTEPELRELHTRGVAGMSPYVATAWFPAALQGQISLQTGFKGYSKTFSTCDVAGLQAIGYAAAAIKNGRADAIVCGASEALSSSFMRALLDRYAHANRMNPSVFGAQTPWPFAEGAAFIVLEERDHAVLRGARTRCEMTGFFDRFRTEARDIPRAFGTRTHDDLWVHDGIYEHEGLNELKNAAHTRAFLGNQFAVSGVTEAVLAAHALPRNTLTSASVGGSNGSCTEPMPSIVIQRLGRKGNVTAIRLAAA